MEQEQPLFNIITRCSRTKNLLKVKDSIFNQSSNVIWFIYFDTFILKDIDAELLSELQSDKIKLFFKKSIPGDYGHQFINDAINNISSGWVYILDDDNILHEDFFSALTTKIKENPNKKAFIFDQKVGGKDFSGVDIRVANPENVKVGHIDMAQFLLKRDLIGEMRLKLGEYKADGYFIEDVYKSNPEDFFFFNQVICYYNYLTGSKMPPSLPKVLLLGENHELKSKKLVDYEDDRLNVKFVDDTDINKSLSSFNPDSIVSIGESFENFPNLSNQSLDVRRRWIHTESYNSDLGNYAYLASMNYILSPNDSENPLISFFTPIYNTGQKLIRTYQSLRDQTYTNWEWVVVNDSTDEGKTLKIVEELAKNDSRIKLYDFRQKSGGVIGESKYRAASLCSGKWIMELDHDDVLTDRAGELMVKAFKLYPDCKFVFSDCAEIDENHNSLTYGDGFAFGYGKYRKEFYNNREYQVAICQNINPLTIRHIVGVPNHFRAWEREFYHSIGGHNRRLTIADDYELIIRSFLKTRFVGIRKLLYLQFFHNSDNLNNTQNSSRADIQRRVRTISNFYNIKIKERFEELGIEDWAFKENPNNPLLSKPRIGDSEGVVNYIWVPDSVVEPAVMDFSWVI
jgi:glycosyltransferase involved in cell wall biosynthesis